MALGLYVHIPFCAAICNYCNFNRGLFDAGLKDRYVAALEQEIRRVPPGDRADTIFFGGGTPSLLDANEVAALLRACRQVFDVSADAEVTLEANPETVTAGSLEAYRSAGVNRLSLGVQSLHDRELARLGRLHGSVRARAAVTDARSAGFDNVSIDLMMWLPDQSLDDWRVTVESAIALAPDHMSLYLLELYQDSPLRDEMMRSRWSLPPDDDAADMYLWAMERLDRAGYGQYEISNVALPRRESRHNLKYWQDGAWLGFGCGAHSTRGAERWKNVTSTTEYIRRVAAGSDLAVERRFRSVEERLGEALFTGLRLSTGLDLATVSRRYGVDVWTRYQDALTPHVDAGRLVREGDRLRLTREGMLVANDVMVTFV